MTALAGLLLTINALSACAKDLIGCTENLLCALFGDRVGVVSGSPDRASSVCGRERTPLLPDQALRSTTGPKDYHSLFALRPFIFRTERK